MFPSFTLLLLATVAFSQTYTVTALAGSDWIGDGGPATQALLFQAEGIAVDPLGNLYIADAQAHRIRQISSSGTIRTFAGTGKPGFSGDGGPAYEAQLRSPYGLTLDGHGNMYIADLGNGRVRRVGPDGRIATVAAAPLISPRNLAIDSGGNLYISDFEGQQVYRLGADGNLVSIVSGLSYPTALAVDRSGALYIGDSGNHVIRKFAGGTLTTVAVAATATGLAIDASGALYIADSASGQILKIPPAGLSSSIRADARDLAFGADGSLYASGGALVTRVLPGLARVVAGGGNAAFGDFGDAGDARLNGPTGVASDALGNVYIADRGNNRVRKVDTNGIITTVAGSGARGDSGDNRPATVARLNGPSSVSLDAAGNVLISDTGSHRVRKFAPGGIILPVAETLAPIATASDPAGNVYIADADAGRIYWAAATGVVVPYIVGLQSPGGVGLDRDGNLFYSDTGAARVWRRISTGSTTEIGMGLWSNPRGVAVSDNGDILVADAGLRRVLRVDSSGSVTALETDATIGSPWGVATGAGGKLYVADPENDRVWMLTPRVEAVNAASLLAGPIAPGMLVRIRGAGADATDVFFGTVEVAILALDDNGILVQVPREIAGTRQIQIDIRRHGASIALIPARVVDAAPGLFTNGGGQAAAVNEDGSVNSVAQPVPRGGWISLYATGEGIMGAAPKVRIGGYTAEVLYSGEVAGYPGLFQINVRIPAGLLAPGSQDVVVTVGEAASQEGVRIAVN
jgi:uncharacterized protein (TIGR03437 family)